MGSEKSYLNKKPLVAVDSRFGAELTVAALAESGTDIR
jgi:hypothetical protein